MRSLTGRYRPVTAGHIEAGNRPVTAGHSEVGNRLVRGRHRPVREGHSEAVTGRNSDLGEIQNFETQIRDKLRRLR